MEKISFNKNDLSLRKSLIVYIIFFTLIAIFLSLLTFFVCNTASERIRDSYTHSGEKYYLTNEQGEQLGEGIYIGKEPILISKADKRKIYLLEIIPIISVPIYSALCIIAAAFLFYKNKLKTPIKKLQIASEKISKNDLEFSVEYYSSDELGQLCESFEFMRKTLMNNFTNMWRQVEERKSLNAAFAHEIRTPLTVLRGYIEIIENSTDPKAQKNATIMKKNIIRIENYVTSMINLRRMEDKQPEYKLINLQNLISLLYDSAKIICDKNHKKLILINDISNSYNYIDISFISQFFDNLISNAIRFAKTSITISFSLHDNGLLLCVSDDGNGFDNENLKSVTKPYFTGEKNNSEHFGIGLYICKLLCENHNGYLKIENTKQGANVFAYFKFSLK